MAGKSKNPETPRSEPPTRKLQALRRRVDALHRKSALALAVIKSRSLAGEFCIRWAASTLTLFQRGRGKFAIVSAIAVRVEPSGEELQLC